MKILSINAEHTADRNHVALNMDESPYFLLSELRLDDLEFDCAEGSTVLKVIVPRGGNEIDTSTIANIESKLRTIAHGRLEKQEKADRLYRSHLNSISAATNLPIDTPETQKPA